MGRINWAVSAAALVFGQVAAADDITPPIAVAAPATTAASVAAARKLVTLKRDTPIDLIATKEINSSQTKPGELFTLAVNTPLAVDGATVLPFMTLATGEVTTASKAGGLGRNGSMSAHLLYVTLGDARIPISGEITNNGGGAGSAAVAVALVGIMGLFHRGNDGRIKAGQHVAAFVAEDVVLDMSASPVRRVEMRMVPADAPSAAAVIVPAVPAATAAPKP